MDRLARGRRKGSCGGIAWSLGHSRSVAPAHQCRIYAVFGWLNYDLMPHFGLNRLECASSNISR